MASWNSGHSVCCMATTIKMQGSALSLEGPAGAGGSGHSFPSGRHRDGRSGLINSFEALPSCRAPNLALLLPLGALTT